MHLRKQELHEEVSESFTVMKNELVVIGSQGQQKGAAKFLEKIMFLQTQSAVGLLVLILCNVHCSGLC